MTIPTNKLLYKKVKSKVYKDNPKHSAYRSGLIVKEYKIQFKKLYPRKKPYIGKKNMESGLTRWFKEKWRSDTDKKHYTSLSSVFRPEVRITKNTPTTFSELSKKEIQSAKRKKYKYGRVKKFKIN